MQKQFYILYLPKPHQFHGMPAIREGGREALPSPYANGMKLRDFTFDLNIGFIILNVGDTDETAAINILIRIVAQKVEGGLHLQLFTKDVGTPCADTLTIRYVTN